MVDYNPKNTPSLPSTRINLDLPQFDQNHFYGRFRHFLKVTDWRLLLNSNEDLYKAKELVENYRQKNEPAGTTEQQIWTAKYLCDSAFHPDTGEKQFILGRMSCQVPGGMLVTGAMLAFYKTTTAVVFWQWLNQSFNALVNYTNRNANSPLTVTQMGVAYVTATSAALVAALSFKSFLGKRSSTLMQRFVPFVAVAAANSANIPLMRQNEILNGVPVTDERGNVVGTSKVAAVKGISQVVLSRVIMAAPGMTVLPLLMERLERRKFFRRPLVNVIFQTLSVGAFLTLMTPASCAIFNQKCSISLSTLKKLEPEAYQNIFKNSDFSPPSTVYFNKGL